MKAPWMDGRCILCLSEGERLTRAHVIPKAIGGTLLASFLCERCNSELGAGVEAPLKSDPAIRLAIAATEHAVPAVAALAVGQRFYSEDERRRIRAARRRKGYAVLDSPQSDGSMIKSDERAIDQVETMLRRSGASADARAAARRRVESAGRGELVRLSPELSIRKDSTAEFRPDLGAPLAPERCFLAIAYLYAALHLAGAVYDESLQPVRDAMRGGDGPGLWRVEALMARGEYEPRHRLLFDPGSPKLLVEIQLFGVLVWQVTLGEIAVPRSTPAFGYEVNLATGEDRIGQISSPRPGGAGDG